MPIKAIHLSTCTNITNHPSYTTKTDKMKCKKMFLVEAGKVALGLLVVVQACSLQTVSITESEMPNDHFFYKGSVMAYTGKCEVKYEGTEVVKANYRYKNGLLHGGFATYYRDGKLESRGYYHEGKATGRWEKWYPNGQMAFVIYQNDNKFHGDYIIYADNGRIVEQGSYFENHKKGEWVYSDDRGNVLQKISY